MDNEKVIIGLLCVIIAVIIIGVVILAPSIFGEDTALSISDEKLNVGDSLVVVLKDSEGNPISNQTINLKLTDKDGITIDEKLITNSKGKAKFKMEEKGKYSVECSFDGNNKYSPSKIVDNVSVKKVKTKSLNQETTTTSSMYDSNGLMYPEYGPDYDYLGTSREEAMAGDYRYMEDVIDGKTIGVYTPYDPVNKCYHW